MITSISTRFYAFIIFATVALLSACGERGSDLPAKAYEGPVMEMRDAEIFFTEDSALVYYAKFPIRQIFENGNEVYPKGLYLENYEKDGQLSATIQADSCTFDPKKKLWHAVGDVRVINIKEGNKLFTDELFWDRKEKKFYTDRFVRLVQGTDVSTGDRFWAMEDFSDYSIENSKHEFSIDEEKEKENENNASDSLKAPVKPELLAPEKHKLKTTDLKTEPIVP
ncbi:LPS export ABC transporter periplasmic protein LptC [Fulvitalea axinellae]|uniref:LPS export ABC transporter periplasmic protein LptC n=1 Tax=Fulvitalea axinellae TaxID=1182444 RepID=A0AAU9CLT0_9BACT|nr:LPS export ABC transporter periplasmic protein LptC [Fulvitalea axinellae]